MTRLPRPSRRPAPRGGGFSLVEVTLALGVVAFAVVSVLGVLPVALSTNRTSIAQTRAAGLAQTAFAGLRAGSFSAASPSAGLEVDGEPPLPPFNLATLGGGDPPIVFYAVLTETEPGGNGADPRRLHFTPDAATRDALLQQLQQAGAAASAYAVSFTFNAQPDGFLAPGAANRVLLTIHPATGDRDSFRFATVIANRGG